MLIYNVNQGLNITQYWSNWKY